MIRFLRLNSFFFSAFRLNKSRKSREAELWHKIIAHIVAIWYLTALTDEDCRGKPPENVIFLHGFLCSSSFWTETVFPNLSEHGKRNYRLFAVDLLGFGRSPKPRDCFYTLKDHLEMIEKSVICPFQLNSFHLVAHSMGCLIAIALAAKHPELVKSLTLVAPVSSWIL